MCLSAACNPEPEPTAEPTLLPATETSLPTATIDWFPRTPTPLPVVSTTPEESQLTKPTVNDGVIIAQDDFSDESLWQTSSGAEGTVAYAEKSLTFAVAANKQSLTSLSKHELPSDFYLEVNLDTLMCSPSDQYGLILWNNSQSGTFRLWLNCEGKIKLERVLPTGTSQLVSWQTGRKLMPGSPATHRLVVWSKEGLLEVYLEDTLQFSHTLHTKPEGVLGVIAQTGGDLPMTIRVSELKIMLP